MYCFDKLFRHDITAMVEWALKIIYLSILPAFRQNVLWKNITHTVYGSVQYPSVSRPDVTFAVDWALKANYLSIPSVKCCVQVECK